MDTIQQCPLCGKSVATHADGKLYRHKYQPDKMRFRHWKSCPGSYRAPHVAVFDLALFDLALAIKQLEEPTPAPDTLRVRIPKSERWYDHQRPEDFSPARAVLSKNPYNVAYMESRRRRGWEIEELKAQASAIRQRRKIFLTPLDSTQALGLS